MLDNGLISYYKLDGNSTDSIATNNGTDTGTLNYNTSNGIINQGIQVSNASTAHINIGSTSSFSFIQNTAEFTISLWWRSINYTGTSYVIGNTGTSSQKGFFLGNVAGSARLAVFTGSGNPNTLINVTTAGLFTDNNWHHIAVTASKSANKVYWYKDGVQTLGSSSVGTVATGNSNNIASMGFNLGGNCNDAIDELGIWNRALSQSEITELYNGGAGLQFPFAKNSFLLMF